MKLTWLSMLDLQHCFYVPVSDIQTNIVSLDTEGLKTIGIFNMSAVGRMREWLDPSHLPVMES